MQKLKITKTALLIEIILLVWTAFIALIDSSPEPPGSPKIIDNAACINELTWEPSWHTNSYLVYRSKDNGKYKHIGTTQNTHFTDKDAGDSDYTYKIAARHILKTSSAVTANIQSATETFSSEDLLGRQAAVALIRSSLKERKNTISLRVKTDQEISAAIFQEALAHTHVPTEGDYIRFQYENSFAETKLENGVEDITYHVSYYSTNKQELETDKKTAEILEELNLNHKSDYEKIKAIYKYIRKNTTYDRYQYVDNNVKRNAYSALVKGETNCQGYALAMYRLLSEAGIDNRIVYGTYKPAIGPTAYHAWNIVKCNGKYYCLDVTNDDLSIMAPFALHTKSEFDKTHTPDDDHIYDEYTYAKEPIGKTVNINTAILTLLERIP